MSILRKIIFVLAIGLLLISCSKDKTEQIPKETKESVYVSGTIRDTTTKNMVACYWKDSTLVLLGENSKSSATSSLVVDNNKKVYVSGYELNSTTGNKAVYWSKGPNDANPTTVNLDSEEGALTYDILVKDNDVYVSGSVKIDGVWRARYWKNGVAHDLTDGTNTSLSTYLALDKNGEIYFGYNEKKDGKYVVKIWNGKEEDEPIVYVREGENLTLTNFFFDGDDLYVGTNHVSPANAVSYWKNDEFNEVTDGSSYVYNTRIGMLKNGLEKNIYIAATEAKNGQRAKYWKNATPTNITDGSYNSSAIDLFIKDKDVYIAFTEQNGKKTEDDIAINLPKYLKNSEIISLPLYNEFSTGSVSSIMVK